MAAYRGANASAEVDGVALWLGHPAFWGVDFIGGESWDNVEWPTWWLEHWSAWEHAQPGRRLILGLPILAGPPDRSGPVAGRMDLRIPVTLEKGAAGAYNHHFRQLAENLVKHRMADVILRPGWEFNGGWYAWSAKGKAEAFAGYWRQIVRTMREVPGAEGLRFVWNPTLGEQDFPAEQAWPGDAYVDFVGLDVYDETWMQGGYPWPEGADATTIVARQRHVWETWTFGSARGLRFWRDFAQAHGKPLSIPEWGVKRQNAAGQAQHGGLDDPYFVEQMHRFISDPANHVAFHGYFDFDCPPPDGQHRLSPGPKGEPTTFPLSSEAFRRLFKER
jgi:hypothetical protein